MGRRRPYNARVLPPRTRAKGALIALPGLLRRPAELTPEVVVAQVAVLIAGVYLAGFLLAGGLRLLFPYPLEPQEDASIQAVRQILQGRPLYAAPALDYVAAIYPPLYFYLSAAVALLWGESFLPLRLVSLLASIGSAGLIYALVVRETTSRSLGLISAGVFVGSTALALNTLDLARVDALGVGLLLGALFALRAAETHPAAARRLSLVAGCLAGLAVLTKQTDALVAIAMLAYLAVWARSRGVPYLIALCLSVGIALLAVYVQSSEWTRAYLLDLPRLHELDDKHIGSFWSDEVLPRFTLPVVFGPLFLVGRAVRGDTRTVSFYALTGGALIGMAWGGWANRQAAFNVLEPAFAALSIFFGLGLAEGLSLLRGGGRELRVMRGYLLVACLAQLLILGYNPRSTVPLRSDRWAGDRLAQAIGALPGRVFAPGFGEWSRRGGKGDQPAYGSLMEIGGAVGRFDPAIGGPWEGALADALRARRYDYVLLDPTSNAFFLKGAAEDNGYVDSGPLMPAGDEFYLWRTGLTPDAHVYVPAERVSRP
jgi:hypothetical protein